MFGRLDKTKNAVRDFVGGLNWGVVRHILGGEKER